MTLTVELWHDAAVFERLKSAWQTLQDNSSAGSIYLTWDWITLWWTHFADRGELWLMEARNAEDELLGLAPLMLIRTNPMRGVHWRQLEFIGTSSPCEYLDFIIKTGHEKPVLRAFLDRIVAEKSRWDVVNLARMPDYSTNLALLQEWDDIPWEEAEQLVAPVIKLPGDWESYFQGVLSRRKRKQQRRDRRELDEMYPEGGWRYVRVTDPEQVATTLDELIKMHQAFWIAQGEAGGFAGDLAAFHHKVAQRFLELGWLELSRLELGDHLAAAFYAYRYRDRIYDFAGGIDHDFSDIRIGHVLTEMVLQHAIDTGVKEYDFLWGEEPYKYRWGAENRYHITLRWIASSRARLEQSAIDGLRTGWRLAKRALPSSLREQIKDVASGDTDD